MRSQVTGCEKRRKRKVEFLVLVLVLVIAPDKADRRARNDDDGGDGGDEDEQNGMSDESSGGRCRGRAGLPDRWLCRGRNLTWTRSTGLPGATYFTNQKQIRGSGKPQPVVVYSQNEGSDEGWSKI